jgi:hypothetical protein
MNRLPGAVFAPASEVGVDRLPGGKSPGQSSPSAAFAQDVEDGIEDRPVAGGTQATSAAIGGQFGRD